MIEEIKTIASLRLSVQILTKAIGLHILSEAQNLVLCACVCSIDDTGTINVTKVLNHSLIKDMPRATFHRCMRDLKKFNFLIAKPPMKTRYYKLGKSCEGVLTSGVKVNRLKSKPGVLLEKELCASDY